jgi:integrase
LESYSKKLELLEELIGDLPLHKVTGLFDAIRREESFLRFEHWKKAAGLRPKFTLHSFRAGFAPRLYRATKDAVLVSNAMGHKSLSSINRYISLKENSIRSAMEKAFR